MTIDTDTLPPLIPKGNDGLFSSVSSGTKLKPVLCTDSKELRQPTYACKEEVKLVLTRSEVIVLKKSSENSSQLSPLRKHPLRTVRASELEECLAANAIVFEVPGTVLCHVYQLEGSEHAGVKEWLTNVHRCKDALLSGSKDEASGSVERDAPKPVNGCLRPAPTPTASLSSGSVDSSCDREREDEVEMETPPKQPAFIRRLSLNMSAMRRSLSTPSSPVISRDGLTRHGNADEGSSFQPEPSDRFNRSASDRVLGRRKGIRPRKQILQKKTPSSPDVSVMDNQLHRELSSSPEPEVFGRQAPSPPPSRSDLQSPFRHTQIRRGHKMFSPRINRGTSVQPRSSTPTPEKYSRANSTPSVRYHSATLPRRNKSKEMTESCLQSSITSPDTSSSPRHLPAKSPKLLKMFHRRWNSSTGIKLHSTEDGDQASSLEPRRPSSAKTASSSSKKLHQLPPKDVAVELTLLDAQMLRKIQFEELENGAWMNKTSKVCNLFSL